METDTYHVIRVCWRSKTTPRGDYTRYDHLDCLHGKTTAIRRMTPEEIEEDAQKVREGDYPDYPNWSTAGGV